MQKSTKIAIASNQFPNQPLSTLMTAVNDIDKQNPEYNLSEIAYTKFIEKYSKQKDIDLIIIATYLEQIHKLVHNDIQIFNWTITKDEKKQLILLYNSLLRENLIYLLLDNLNKITTQYINNFVLHHISNMKYRAAVSLTSTTKQKQSKVPKLTKLAKSLFLI